MNASLLDQAISIIPVSALLIYNDGDNCKVVDNIDTFVAMYVRVPNCQTKVQPNNTIN